MSQPIPVLLVHWNRPEACLRSVRALLRQRTEVAIRVLDNASEAPHRARLARLLEPLPPVQVDFRHENLGFAGAVADFLRELALSGSGPGCIVAAHDILPEPDAVRLLLEALEDDRSRGLAFPARESLQEGLWNPIRGPRTRPLEATRLACSRPVAGLFFPAPCVAISRQALSRGVALDPRLFAYYEECDLGLSALRAGLGAVLVPSAVVHNSEPGGSVAGTRLVSYLMARNSVLLASKYGGRAAALLRSCLVLSAATRGWLTGAGRTPTFSSTARVRGVVDALAGRFGRPPKSFFAGRETPANG